ncbi:putative transcriptional regulator protein [Sinorhizobium fredii NGR234]|uniref:Transcriptional regulator protein n=1 Tax=Sinorhizobium fredii (strain NBRC 101917 / NGR234) TaxID=394 RepID=C3MED6_SINFN|nr:dimethylsulfonioproprionate lyase family protein [Sinorhizobium fredii]ACP25805.1 putative transcriptional regulator protein [Sinorhizobium fredii NGR234]
MLRSEPLQGFLDAAFVAFDRFAVDTRARQSIMQVFSRLASPLPIRQGQGRRLPVVDRFLATALETGSDDAVLAALLDRFKAIEEQLEWKTRSIYDHTASATFLLGHGNALIVGPQALEDRTDAWIGASLLAPDVRYPDHNHAPEETYLVLSEGEFSQAGGEWFAPGIGGSFFNPPNIKHAMRSGTKPLFAFWALLPDTPQH